jgi:hypothetical protein
MRHRLGEMNLKFHGCLLLVYAGSMRKKLGRKKDNNSSGLKAASLQLRAEMGGNGRKFPPEGRGH